MLRLSLSVDKRLRFLVSLAFSATSSFLFFAGLLTLLESEPLLSLLDDEESLLSLLDEEEEGDDEDEEDDELESEDNLLSDLRFFCFSFSASVISLLLGIASCPGMARFCSMHVTQRAGPPMAARFRCLAEKGPFWVQTTHLNSVLS